MRVPYTPTVYSVAIQSDGKVLIRGGFEEVNGYAAIGVARLNADGTLDRSFQASSDTTYSYPWSAIAEDSDGRLIVGGLSSINGIAAPYPARIWQSDFPPVLKEITQNGTGANLTWRAIADRTYRVQFNTDLTGSTWIDLPGDVPAIDATATTADTTPAGAPQRFYRVVALP